MLAARDVESMLDLAREPLRSSGIALIQMPRPPAADELLALGRGLGPVMPETHPSVQDRVELGVILNLARTHASTADVELQPFAANPLLMHTEHSLRPASAQPRYIVLSCLTASVDDGDALTLVSPTSSVVERLSAEHRDILHALRLEQAQTPILRTHDGQLILSFRDFGAEELRWVFEHPDGKDVATVDVVGALKSLLESIYDPSTLAAVRWREGLVAIIDNWAALHGRTASRELSSPRPRHLQRIRIAPS